MRRRIEMVNVVGLGYIGLPTALMMASHGVDVVGTDYDADRIARLQRGEIVFEEEGLEELFRAAVDSGIRFSAEYQQADIYIVAVPTPYNKANKKLDASFVVNAVKNVLQTAPKGAVIVVESTISPGTIDRYVKPVIAEQGFSLGEDIHIAHAPERIIPGNMIYELKHNSRTIGADERAVAERIRSVYASFCEGEIVLTDIKTAEMSKVVENTFRDINIAFANELAKICRSDNMDVYETKVPKPQGEYPSTRPRRRRPLHFRGSLVSGGRLSGPRQHHSRGQKNQRFHAGFRAGTRLRNHARK